MLAAPEVREGPHRVPVLAAWDETGQHRGLRLAVPAPLMGRYRVPGQHLAIEGLGGGRVYLALAAAPSRTEWELLIKRGSPRADALASIEPGSAASILVSDVLGPGYPLAEARGRDLVLVAAGSGIAPLRAVVQAVLNDRQRFGDVALYYGQRDSGSLAYAGEFAQWRRGGVTVVPVFSRPSGDGKHAYVQDRLGEDPPAFLGPKTSALLCGMKAMVAETIEVLAKRGVPRHRILLNH